MSKVVFFLLAVTTMAPAAFAQPTPATPTAITTAPGSAQSIDEIRRNYHVHAGPLYVNPAILLKELGLDTNVFNQEDEQKSDFTFTITPKADVALPIARRGLLRTTVGVDTVYYAHYVSERSLDPQVVVRGEAYANRVTLFAEGAYFNTRERPNYEVDLRSRHVQNDLRLGTNVSVTRRLAFEVSGQKGKTRYDADAFFLGQSLRETLDRDTSGYTLIARERLSPLTTLAVRYDNEQDRFPLAPVRDNDTYRVMPGIEFKPRALISGSAFVGYRKLSPKSPLLPAYTGLVSQLALAYTLLGATTFGVTYDRDVEYSYEVTNPYYLDNSIGVFVRRALGGRFDTIVSAARHRSDYRDLVGVAPAPIDPRVDTTDTYGGNVGYRLQHATRVGFGATYATRQSTRETFRQYDRLRVGTTVTYGF